MRQTLLAATLLFSLTGCYREFEPVKLEVINTSEEGFLIPLVGDKTKQGQTNSEADLKANLVNTKQVQIPQQWVPKGYQTWAWNGVWQDGAKLIKVDRSPVTREWTADPASGTSTRNEAIWVMTSDQVEFSTGWTCTARINGRDSSVKFLHNYPNGSLKDVLDQEVRAKIQSAFGIEVTDLPMDELRKAATPHIVSVVKKVTEFFAERGIEITNLGITGGFVYKDPNIIKTMTEVFQAEQQKSIKIAGYAAQEEDNKRIKSTAEVKAASLLTEKKAEADGIKLVADAKFYEISKAKEDLKTYLELKRLELEKEKLTRWDGKFPQWYFGGSTGQNPAMLLSVPSGESK